RRRVTPDLLEDRRDLEEAEARAAVRLGHRRGEQPRLGERLPQLAVEAHATALLERAHALVAGEVVENLAGELCDRLLVVGKREVHVVLQNYMRGMRGKPRPNRSMRSRWISFVPPPKVRIRRPR